MVDVRILLRYDPAATPRIEVLGWKVVPRRFSNPDKNLIENAAGQCLEADKRILRVTDLTPAQAKFLQSEVVEEYKDARDAPARPARRREWGPYYRLDWSKIPAAIRTRFHNGDSPANRTYTINRTQLRALIEPHPKIQELINAGKIVRAPRWLKPSS